MKNNKMMKKMENGEKVIRMVCHVTIGPGIGAASVLRLGLVMMRRNIQR